MNLEHNLKLVLLQIKPLIIKLHLTGLTVSPALSTELCSQTAGLLVLSGVFFKRDVDLSIIRLLSCRSSSQFLIHACGLRLGLKLDFVIKLNVRVAVVMLQ
ncbi:hypothetical protein ATANTOWER_017461 [Ataeniobius toweri]|uniref:Uncharacterized protein n=1 Tax=Ataeniobius toweri TaxID=208326 RepID=A0ABU7APP4_9TELE|nr:hypothetical protein [Ataeniobius toweri]